MSSAELQATAALTATIMMQLSRNPNPTKGRALCSRTGGHEAEQPEINSPLDTMSTNTEDTRTFDCCGLVSKTTSNTKALNINLNGIKCFGVFFSAVS